jgi:hypothetical protein
MTFEELRQQVGAKDLILAGKVQKPFPAELKSSQYGDYWKQNVLVIDSAGEKAYVGFKWQNEQDQITSGGQMISLKISPVESGGKIYFNGKIGVATPQRTQQSAPQRQAQTADSKDTYWRDKTEFDKLCQLHKDRGVALSYGLKLAEIKAVVYGTTEFWTHVNFMLTYIQDGVPHKPRTEGSFEDKYDLPQEPEDSPVYPQGGDNDTIPY